MDIALDYSQPVKQQSYLIQSDNLTTVSVPVADMPLFIPKPPVPMSTATNNDHLLPEFLQLKRKILTNMKDNTTMSTLVSVMVFIGLFINVILV